MAKASPIKPLLDDIIKETFNFSDLPPDVSGKLRRAIENLLSGKALTDADKKFINSVRDARATGILKAAEEVISGAAPLRGFSAEVLNSGAVKPGLDITQSKAAQVFAPDRGELPLFERSRSIEVGRRSSEDARRLETFMGTRRRDPAQVLRERLINSASDTTKNNVQFVRDALDMPEKSPLVAGPGQLAYQRRRDERTPMERLNVAEARRQSAQAAEAARPRRFSEIGAEVSAQMDAEEIRTGRNRNFPGTPTSAPAAPTATTATTATAAAETAAAAAPKGGLGKIGAFAKSPAGGTLLAILGTIAAQKLVEQGVQEGSFSRRILFGEEAPGVAEARRQAGLQEALRLQAQRRENLMTENARRMATQEPRLFQQLLHKRRMLEGDRIYGGGQDRSALNQVLLAMSEGRLGE